MTLPNQTDPAGATVVGLQPWYPPPLSWWPWWNRPVRGERLAAVRIGLSALLLFDVLTTYLPNVATFYGKGSLGEWPIYREMWTATRWDWSLLYGVEEPSYLYAAMIVWIIALIGLLVGCFTRVCSVIAFVLSTSFANLNSDIDNAGDTVRGIILLYLALSPCAAVWSVDAWRRRRTGPIFIPPWPLQLLLLQLIVIYWSNGMHKVVGRNWQVGDSLYYVLGDATITRWSKAQFSLPYRLTRLMTWTVLAWEVSFPFLLLADVLLTRWARLLGKGSWQTFWSWRPLRLVALGFGVPFHLGIWISMELGLFGGYMLCLYLPLVPWERWVDRRLERFKG
jgi:uncharacterized membrane protein YphA (DoxX/SURF4 family)